jgi:hypothetical protein
MRTPNTAPTAWSTKAIVATLGAMAALILTASTSLGAWAAQSPDRPTDLLTGTQVKALVASAKTPADHLALAKHFTALAARYDADAADHGELAAAYRKNPNASETKRPGAPDTAIHCEGFARLASDAAKEARAMAMRHEAMAAGR